MNDFPRAVVSLGLGIALSGCAHLTTGQAGSPDDPLEPLNRAVFETNIALDDALIKPVAQAYRDIVPEFVRDRIRSAIDNLAEPRIFVNDLLQGRLDPAGITLSRFFINTIAGIGGLFDRATPQGFARQSGDFGQTLFAWGVADGPYVVLLLFGPSNVRDTVGLGVDLFTTPPALVVSGHAGRITNAVVGTLDGIDLRARNIETLEEIKKSALDLYVHLKSITRQRREAQLREARGEPEQPIELTDPGAPASEPPR